MRRFLLVLHAYSLALLVATTALSLTQNRPVFSELHSEWPVWLTAAQAIGMAAIIAVAGRPASRREWLALVLWNMLLAACCVLWLSHRFETALYWLSAAALRLAVAAAWTLAVAGLPVALWRLRSRRRDVSRPPAASLWWFSAVVLLLAAEPLAALVERGESDSNERLAVPENLPAPPAGEFHIAAIGGSTMRGTPYTVEFSIPRIVARQLRPLTPEIGNRDSSSASPPAPRILVHNLAREGHNLRLAIGELRTLEWRPHLLLVYTGHNEFYHDVEELVQSPSPLLRGVDDLLRFSPAFRIGDRVLSARFVSQRMHSQHARKLIDRPIVSPAGLERRVMRFRRQLEQLAGYCRHHRITTLWFVPAASEAGYEPNRSVVAPGAGEDECAELIRLYRAARAHEQHQQWAAAADLYRQGLDRHPEFAEFQFRLGRCLLWQQQFGEARERFARALECDGYPVRATAPFRNAVADVAAANAIACIDARALLRAHAPRGILDATLFHDNVHPTLRGMVLLGTAAAEQIASMPSMPCRLETPLTPPDPDNAVADLGFGPSALADACELTAQGLRQLAWLRFDPTERLRRAQRYEDRAGRLRSGAIHPGDETDGLPD